MAADHCPTFPVDAASGVDAMDRAQPWIVASETMLPARQVVLASAALIATTVLVLLIGL